MRVALVHYWLLGQRGGEKVLEAMCRLFPEAEIFTLFYDPSAVSPLIRSRTVHVSALNPLRKVYRYLLPLMPMALESLDLREYDLIISSESGPAKGIIASSKSRHICYCHTPMRYLWELSTAYRQSNPLTRALYAPLSSYLRLWDYASAARVDQFLANSLNVKQRIWRAWRRRARVVYPPVAVGTFRHEASRGYFLAVSELVAYKRLDQAIRAFSRNGRKLRIVGDGPEYGALRRIASPNIEFCGRVPDCQLRELYAQSAAFIVPCEEDFGIAMVESLASGKPVIALARGGATEIVENGCGVLYEESGPQALEDAIARFDRVERLFAPERLRARAAHFSEEQFEVRFRAALETRVTPPRPAPTEAP